MVSQIYTVGLMGIDGFIVNVQADIANGMPAFDIIGLPDAAVRKQKRGQKLQLRIQGVCFLQRE